MILQPNRPLRMALFGQKPIAEYILDNYLSSRSVQSGIQVELVCTNTVPVGWWNSAGLYHKAVESTIRAISNDYETDQVIQEVLAELDIDFVLSVQHPRILSSSTLEFLGGHAYNLHLAPLPRFRGWNSISHAIIEGHSSFGVTLHKMSKTVDQGAIVELAEFALPADGTAQSVYNHCVSVGIEVVQRFLIQLAQSGLASVSLSPMVGESRYYKRNSLDQFRDVSGLNSTEIDRVWRALYFPPFPAPYIRIGNNRVYLRAEDR